MSVMNIIRPVEQELENLKRSGASKEEIEAKEQELLNLRKDVSKTITNLWR